MDRKKVAQTLGFGSDHVCNKNTSEEISSPISGVRRRNGPQSLRSPAAKRPLSAPVAYQGWLHKQGSDGLMLWKKRWFVLCEYCLFYYKGPEEEKLLGSILLPSYTITVCKPDEKINRKFAFKAEHANMRTYHFAADSLESMNHWINVLTLASLLQDPNPETNELIRNSGNVAVINSNVPTKQYSVISNQSAEDSDAGFKDFQTKSDINYEMKSNPLLKTPETNYYICSSNNNDKYHPYALTNKYQHAMVYGMPRVTQEQRGNQMILQPQNLNEIQFSNQYYAHQPLYKQPPALSHNYELNSIRKHCGQPIYANASKSKIFNKSTTCPNNMSDMKYKNAVWNNAEDKTVKNVMEHDLTDSIYENKSLKLAEHNLRTDKLGLNYTSNLNQSPERRTPDTYGRSNKSKTAKDNEDYEDVYTGLHLNQTTFNTHNSRIPQDYNKQNDQEASYAKQIKAHPPRPHSADFLEHEVKRRSQKSLNQYDTQNRQKAHPQRPKSSIDVISPHDTGTNDNYFYSEEHYAAQMRQRAAFLHQTPQAHQQQRNEVLSSASPASVNKELSDNNQHDGFEYSSKNGISHSDYQIQSTLPKSSKRFERFNKDNVHMRRSLREKNVQPMDQEFIHDNEKLPLRVPREHSDLNPAVYNSKYNVQSYSSNNKKWRDQWFTRSASARFPSNRNTMFDNQENYYTNRNSGYNLCEGERKREESMKRLLEWKQRMLQSPLTRKPASNSSAIASQNELPNYCKQNVLLDNSKKSSNRHSWQKEDKYQTHVRSKSSDGRRVKSVISYDNYSSDDEDLEDKQMRRLSRSTDPIKNVQTNAGMLDFSSCENLSRNEQHHSQTNNDWKSIVANKNDLSLNYLTDYKISDNFLDLPAYKQNNLELDSTAEKPMFVKQPKGILKTSSSSVQSLWNNPVQLNSTDYMSNQSAKYVQWNSLGKKKQWDSKIDEHDVVKELSYQYVKPKNVAEQSNSSDPTNSVQNKIKSFELTKKDNIKLEKPLKVSSLQTTEAHISKLDSSKINPTYEEKSLYNVDNSKECQIIEDVESLDAPTRDKTVKDLLADFEKKSKLIEDESLNNQDVKNRGVLSDTEILLYDTGSDLDQVNKSSEEDDEHEVIQNLDQVKRKNDLTKKRRRRKTLKMSMYTEAILAENEKCLRESDQSTVNEFLISNDDKNSSLSSKQNVSLENIYLPMNPRKAILNPNNEDDSNPAMQHLFENLEESSYVEMTQRGLTHSLLAPDGIDDKPSLTPHYEFVCVSENVIEPVYMEVNQFTKNKAEGSKFYQNNRDLVMRSDLPDILNNLKSDSSDADDESSKDLNSIDTPRHPRFSLSDTFRPASYYLGASQTLMAEMQDSSDSDLVSPPPIPTSPPPMDDLDSLEMQESLQIRNKIMQTPVSRLSFTSEDSNVESIKSPAKYSTPKLNKKEGSMKNESIQLLNEDENKMNQQSLKRRPVSNEICQVLDILDQLKTSNSNLNEENINLDQHLEELKMKPINNFDMYLKDLSYNSIYNEEENSLSAEKVDDKTSKDPSFFQDQKLITKTNSVSSLPSMRVTDILPCHQHSLSFTGDAHYENIKNFAPLPNQKSFMMEPQTSVNATDSYFNIPPSTNSLSRMRNFQQPPYFSKESLNKYSTTPKKFAKGLNSKTYSQSNVDIQNAPYYYSDLNTQGDIDISLQTGKQIEVGNSLKDFLAQHNYGKSDKYISPNKHVHPTTYIETKMNEASNHNKMIDNNLIKKSSDMPTSHRRSRSLEGLLDDVGLQNFITSQAAAPQTPLTNVIKADTSDNVSKQYSFDGDDPWEQDSLWRESLRTVSLRQAKSLDNLDNSIISQVAEYDKKNEDNKKLLNELDSRHGKKKHYLPAEQDSKAISSSSMVESRAKNSFELDREKLRQWDLLSSACLLQEQQQAELVGRGLPIFELTRLLSEARNSRNESVTSFLDQETDRSSTKWLLKNDNLEYNK